ncbi:Zcf27p [Didymosphaeria variabile]|uniref:Zcf27p n=1 Tax=Didymosphaeria variabile TaxID=1932322 RepID=A0A9W9CBV6_9PLEO|nr:Zcf27p [Didymosphaeria variabile]KAJ4355794.1 Zcf27p [Didymosphaeria variabile]
MDDASVAPLPSLDGSNGDAQDPLLHNPVIGRTSTPDSSTQLPQVPRHEYFGSSEDVLAWPIFAGKYDRRWIEALIFDPTLPSDDLSGTPTSPRVNDDSLRNTFEDPRQASQCSPAIREEDVPHLVEAFLLNVHVKNPIFDPNYLRSMAKAVVDRGFDWEASSCLVLTVCALAAISSTFACRPIRENNASSDNPILSESSLSTTTGYHTAEAYYTASRKRIGLLKDTLLATECHFMSGVYEMYSLRPLQAAISFNRACVTFQTLTWMRTEYYITESQLGKARASRLYWSCLKSEHEVSIEIRFPSSGLTKLNYTSAFPPPPSATSTEEWYRMYTEVEAESPQSMHSAWTQNEFERGWYYYLADIAARRLLQRVIELFYKRNEVAWLEFTFSALVHTVEELDRQLVEW